MKKHLRLRATLDPKGSKAILTIIGQSHFEDTLGNYSHTFEMPGERIVLFGTSMASRFQDDKYLCLNKRHSESFYIPAEIWPRVKKLVEAYNEWGGSQ